MVRTKGVPPDFKCEKNRDERRYQCHMLMQVRIVIHGYKKLRLKADPYAPKGSKHVRVYARLKELMVCAKCVTFPESGIESHWSLIGSSLGENVRISVALGR